MFSDEIGLILGGLQRAPSMFDGRAFFYQPMYDESFRGITDDMAVYAYVQDTGEGFEVVNDIQIVGCEDGSIVFGRFKLIVRADCPFGGGLVHAIANRVVTAADVRITRILTDAEQVYFEETDERLTAPMYLIKIEFDIRRVIQFSECPQNPCCDDC